MRKSFLITAFVLAGCFAFSQPASLDVSLVPAGLKQNANVIKRYENIILTIESVSKADLKVHRIVTVLNEKGRNALVFNEYTSKNRSLKNAEIKVYNAEGKQLSRHKKKEMQTTAVGEGLIEDGYVTYFPVSTFTYPVTIESEYELEIEGTLFLPPYVICTENEGVEQSSFTAKVPANAGFRFKTRNISLTPTVTELGKDILYQWTVNGLTPFDEEEGSVSSEDRIPSVIMAVNSFSYYGLSGNLSTWKNFGEWVSYLYKGLDELSPEKKEFFKALVIHATNEREKARILYDYLQKNFRYVSIQLGIGGLRPFSAQFTDQKKYGDCKSLSNYMKTALDAVGIKSYLAIINAGYNNEPVDPAFPINDFNHVILCIPGSPDSLWLECTSSTIEFGHLGTFTENRNALLITENGGVLVQTPQSRSRSNQFFVTTYIDLAENGSGSSKIIFKATGEFRQQLDEIYKAKRNDQQEALVLGFGFKQPDDFEFEKNDKDGQPGWQLNMTLEKVQEFSTGSKLFLPARLYKIWPKKLPGSTTRKNDFYFRFPFELTDTTIIKLPDDYNPEILPESRTIRSEYGEYITKYWFDEKQKSIYSTARFVLKEYKIPAVKYADLKKFSEAIMEDEATRLVIKK